MKLILLLSMICLAAANTTQARPASAARFSSSIVNDTIPGTDKVIYETVEKEAEFPGGVEGWRRFLEQNLNPMIPIDKGAPAGTYTVFVQFVVSKDGKLSDIKALTKHGYGMENEVIRIIRKSPEWLPAVQDDHTVNAYRKQPVTFQIVEEKKKRKGKG